MMSPSLWQILVVVLLMVVLFGRGKISDMMGDVAKGIRSFKKGMAEDDSAEPAPRVAHREDAKAPAVTAEDAAARPTQGA